MIIFRDDWVDRHPTAIIDTQTKNESFLRLAAIYKQMGVKNHSFILSLINPSLQGIDPHDPNLSKEQMLAIVMECKMNFWYYLREVVRVPSKSGNSKNYFRANRGNIAITWLFFNHITSILIQPRQTGKSLTTSILMRYLLNIGCSNTYMTMVTKDEALRAKTIEDIKDVEVELPVYLRMTTRRDIKNTEMLTVKALGNKLRGFIAQKSKKAAANIGRGLTSPIFWFDEIAFLYNIQITLPAALAAGTAARDEAKRNNEPWGTLLTTTAGKKDDPDGRFVYNMLSNSAVWTEQFFDAKDHDELETLIRKNSPKGELRVNCTFSHRQLGYTDDWLRETIELTNATGEDADRDFFNVWTSGSVSSPIVQYADMIRNSLKEPTHTDISKDGYITRWYIPEHKISTADQNTHLIMALDTSEAIGQDDIAMVIRDVTTGGVIAAGNYNETNLISFSEWLVSWFTRYNNLTLIIERRSSGSSIIDYLLRILPTMGIDPFKRIFNWVVNDYETKPQRFETIRKLSRYKQEEVIVEYRKYFGFATSGGGRTSRNDLYSNTLVSSAKYTGDRVHDSMVIEQLLSLTVRNGRIDHTVSGHDDMVIAWLLSYWFMTQGQNLSYYGIDPRSILRDNTNVINTSTIKDQKEKQRQLFIKKEINSLIDQIKKERDIYIITMLEHRLIKLLQEADTTNVVSLDELISELKDNKRLQMLLSKYK